VQCTRTLGVRGALEIEAPPRRRLRGGACAAWSDLACGLSRITLRLANMDCGRRGGADRGSGAGADSTTIRLGQPRSMLGRRVANAHQLVNGDCELMRRAGQDGTRSFLIGVCDPEDFVRKLFTKGHDSLV
jgi:hypothetical protein